VPARNPSPFGPRNTAVMYATAIDPAWISVSPITIDSGTQSATPRARWRGRSRMFQSRPDFAPGAAHGTDPRVAEEEHQASREQTEDDAAATAREIEHSWIGSKQTALISTPDPNAVIRSSPSK
jgi:hypothetical protein